MQNQFKRKLAAFLAAVMFTTSLPVPVVAEDSAETIPAATVETVPETTAETTSTLPTESETVPTTVPETEPATEPVTEPATEPQTEPVTEPATEPVTESVPEPDERSEEKKEAQPDHYPAEGLTMARSSLRSSMMAAPVLVDADESLPDSEFEYTISSDGAEAYLYGYLGELDVAEVVIPGTIQGATVVGIYGGDFLKNNGTLKKVTIPASVGYIADGAFSGSTDLTIYGYSGSEAETFAVSHNYTFAPMDSGESTVSATWVDPILVNAQTTIQVSAPGADDVELRVDGSVAYNCQTTLTENGATILWTPERSGSQTIQVRARMEGEYISSRYYSISVVSNGVMPQVGNLTPSAATIEPGTAVSLNWTAPEGVTAPEYDVGILTPGTNFTDWVSVPEGQSAYTFGSYRFNKEGAYTLSVRLKGTAGMESSVTSCTVEVKSTQLWDYNASSKTLLAYNGTDTDITIPSEINSEPVLYLGSSLFKDSDITSVTIPEGVKSIGRNTFYGCDKLTSATLPSTLTEIGDSAFSGCTSLAQIQLPAELTTLDSSAFQGCDSLTSIVIPDKITVMKQSVFYSCDALSQVTLPENLTSIEAGAFSYCKQLKTITIPQSVNSISQYAFQYVEGLTIHGYSGSAAEAFAEAQGYTFVALGEAETGEISFTLKSDQVYQSGYLNITVTAPAAEKLRVYLDNNVTEYSISNGEAELSLFASYSLGEHSVTVSQCVNGNWLAPCAVKTFTVIEMPKPVLEPIAPTPVGTPVLVRWKPVEGAGRYTLYLSKDGVNLADFQNVQNLDEEGYVYQQLDADLLTHAGQYDLQVTAHMSEGGNTYGHLSFQVTEAEEFVYSVNSDGTATLTGCNSTAQAVTVPAQLDGHAVVTIAQKAFLNTPATTIELPTSVQLVEQWAFSGCEALETVKILDAQATLCQFAFVDCTRLVNIHLGKGVFADDSAFDSCREDTVIYGYSGGQVEEVANRVRQFSSLGELAVGPAIAAEDIWKGEELNYSVSYENAQKLYIQVVYPDGSVESGTYTAAQREAVADSQHFENLTEDSQVAIKAAALMNGAWTAYTEKKVTVSVLKKLTTPVFEEFGRLERHVDQVIKWNPVENAQNYQVIISSGLHVINLNETVKIPEVTLRAGSLLEGDYTIRVTAMAEGCEDATGSAEFEMISLKLEQPVIAVDNRIARHLGARITWEAVSAAENYTVVVQTEGTNGPLTLYKDTEQTATEVTLTPEQLIVGNCTVSVTANALYCTSSDTATATFEVYEEPLDAPEITVPEAVVGGIEFDVTWKSVKNAEGYHLEIVKGDGNRVFSKTVDSSTLSQTILLDAYLPEETLTLRVISSANYRVDGVAEQSLAYKPLYSYEIVDNTAVITGYNGTDTELTIPGQINGYDVTAIGEDTFADMAGITKVLLPASVYSIGKRGFKNCTALAWIEGEGVKEIGSEAFCNCSALAHIRFGGNDEAVKAEPDAFDNTPVLDGNASGGVEGSDNWLEITVSQDAEVKDYSYSLFLRSITYEEGITNIPERTHYSNLMLEEVNLPESLRTIGSEAFAECPSLSYIRVYDGITQISEDAFANAPNLCLYIYTMEYDKVSYVEQYAITHRIPYVKRDLSQRQAYTLTYPDGTITVEEKDCLADDLLLKVILPETVKTIGSQAFAQCGMLNEVYLYDGITSLADDAFEGSARVRFILYVQDLDAVSYAEQYAIDHEIPYEKYLRPGSGSAVVDLKDGDTSPITVKIDEPVFICVTDISAEAERLLVYLDEELVYAPALDQNTEIQFTHIFRDFGEHTLTAETYLGEEMIKVSPRKPVTVVGIRLQADREEAWTGETVNFAVEAYPEAAELSFYAEDLLFGTVPLTENIGSIAYAFTEAGEREVTARSVDGRVSRTLTLSIQCIGQLEQPVLEAGELQYVDNGLVCSWNTTENTDGYMLRVRNASGHEVERRIQDDGSKRMTCVIPAGELGGEGSYQLYLMNYGYKYDQNESETITVELTADKTPRFTMDQQSVMTGEPVVFTFRAFDATSVELWCDGEVIETISLTDGRGTLTRTFTQSGDREMQIRALHTDGWSELSEVQLLKVTSLGALDAVQVATEPVQLLGNSIQASWTAVKNADGYTVYFRNTSHDTLWQLDTADCVVRVPAEQVSQAGGYYFLVMAHGVDYDQSEGSAFVSVVEELPGPAILTPEENEVCTNRVVTLTWEAVAGADSYVVSLARKTDQVDATGQPVYEKVWAAPSETVNVGTALSYELTGLVYGEEYRVAVGTVAAIEDGTERVGWSERLFRCTDPDAAIITSVTMDPGSAIAGKTVTFTVLGNANTTRMEVYLQKAVGSNQGNTDTNALVQTVTPTPVDGGTVCIYSTVFEEAGEVTLRFVPCNAKSEKGEAFIQPVMVYPKSKLPDPVITAPAMDANVSTAGCKVTWDSVVLGPGETFGGYSVTVYKVGSTGHWEVIPGHTDSFVGNTCYYDIPAMAEGEYRAEVYTVLAGMNVPSAEFSGVSVVEFWMKDPAVAVTAPASYASCLTGSPIPMTGTAVGDVTKVAVQIVTAGINPKVLPVKDGAGNAVNYLVVDVVDGKFSAVLDPVENLTPANYGIEVYGFLDGMTIDPAATNIKNYRMIRVESARLLADNHRTRHWKFDGGAVQFRVETGISVQNVVLYDRTSGSELPVTFTRDDTTAGVHIFHADTAVALSGEGLHEIVARDTDGHDLTTLALYIVTPTRDIPKSCPSGQTVRVWMYPVGQGGYLRDVTHADTLVQTGTCGDYLLVEVNGTSSGFVHKDKLEAPFVIVFPNDGFKLDLSMDMDVELRWTTNPRATSYKVSIDVEIINEQGKREIVTFEKPGLLPQQDEYQWTTFNTAEIYAMVRRRCNFYTSHDWPITIRIGAYA